MATSAKFICYQVTGPQKPPFLWWKHNIRDIVSFLTPMCIPLHKYRYIIQICSACSSEIRLQSSVTLLHKYNLPINSSPCSCIQVSNPSAWDTTKNLKPLSKLQQHPSPPKNVFGRIMFSPLSASVQFANTNGLSFPQSHLA